MNITTTRKAFVSYVRLAGVLLRTVLLLFSCSKEDGSGQEPEPDPAEKSELVLTASAVDVDKGEQVTFEVKADGKAIATDIYINDEKISGTSHTFDAVGIHQVVAKKDGYTDSEIIEIKSYQVDVYVAGSTTMNNRMVALYWKNGTPVTLSAPPQNTTVYAILVENGNVHAVGAELVTGYHNKAKYWRNGSSIELENGRSASSIFVDNGNIYISGTRSGDVISANTVAKYWKNGVSVDLSDGSQIETTSAITVDNGDVYVAGTRNKVSTRIAQYWKNGTAVALTDGTQNAFTTGIAVDDGTVYVSGHEDAAPKYWKDGTPVMLNDGRYSVYTSSMLLDDGAVYVAGHGHEDGLYADVAKYWKDGVPVVLTDGKSRSFASSIFVNNGDVYVAGYEGITPVYWKNGTAVVLNDGNSAKLNSIYVTRSLGDD